MKLNVRSLIAGSSIIIVLIAVIFFIRRQHSVYVQAPPAPALAALMKTKGPDAAPVKIIEYSDFGCPSCRGTVEPMREFFEKYPGKIQLTYRHFPLTSHRWSIYAHQAAECMNLQGKFWPYHDMLYEKQQEWVVSATPPTEFFLKYAESLGANMDLFKACVADVGVTREIYAEKESGTRLQVNATPTLLVGDERFVGSMQFKDRAEDVIKKLAGISALPGMQKAEAGSKKPAVVIKTNPSADLPPPPLPKE